MICAQHPIATAMALVALSAVALAFMVAFTALSMTDGKQAFPGKGRG